MTSRAEARHPELTRRCRWCRAAPGAMCTNKRGFLDEPHGGRRDDWIRATTDCASCSAATNELCITEAGHLMEDHVHAERAQAADAMHATSLEDSSQDVPERRR
ncbi:hypothetical protein ABTZ78_17030 [Streptomyces bauhiniae]|uniref:zinc finger domain-containing protein n=1 Tax=Streptomyces bauhiniae TaxID=2340725 RepID=UPI00331860BE